ncbi:MAG: hypothetical protein CSB47_10475 [Proteobacteria bacterium]|nr:MAG: hypothetical protein CSB47_10475 [Pseudomonadota bacterium]
MSNHSTTPPATYSIRMPSDMRKALEESAKLSGRSLHAEILLRLDASITRSTTASDSLSDEQIKQVRGLIREEMMRETQ